MEEHAMMLNELYAFVGDNPKGTEPPDPPVIYGELNLVGRQITWLPRKLIVTGDMAILHCPNLMALPAEMFVGGDLLLDGSQIKEIPADLDVRGNIYAYDMDLNIPAGYTTNGGLDLRGDTRQEGNPRKPLQLPDNLTVNGDLDVSGRKVKWPKNLIVKGRLILDHQLADQIPIGVATINGNFCVNGDRL